MTMHDSTLTREGHVQAPPAAEHEARAGIRRASWTDVVAPILAALLGDSPE